MTKEAEILAQVDKYINTLKVRPAEWNHFWKGCLGGSSKTDKLAAAQALRGCIEKPLTVLELIDHMNVLDQGDLRVVWKFYIEYNPNGYNAILSEIESRRPKQYSGGYDSDTPERMQGRCSKD